MQRPHRSKAQTERARELRRDTSRTERKLWLKLRSSQLGAPFRRQHPIDRYYADYCCVPLKLVVEVDGPSHDWAKDAVRDQRMQDLGFDILRFSVEDIDHRLDEVAELIHARLQLRSQALESPRIAPS